MPIDRNLLLVAEHWMMYAEARTFNDAASAAAVLVAATRTDARRVESRVTGSSQMSVPLSSRRGLDRRPGGLQPAQHLQRTRRKHPTVDESPHEAPRSTLVALSTTAPDPCEN